MMKLRYFSDLHLEFIKPQNMARFLKQIPIGLDEICILAGDIGNPYNTNYYKFINFININFKKSFIITGNHEYYNKKQMNDTDIYLEKYFEKYGNISFLNNKFEIYNGYCFIGTTLWSKITNPEHEINDVYNIQNFDYKKYNIKHEECVEFLTKTVELNNNCVVISHHVPSFSLTDDKYKIPSLMPYQQWFNCDMDDFIEKNQDKLKCWIYGHTHVPSNKIINDIPFLCNPIGYIDENETTDFTKSITL